MSKAETGKFNGSLPNEKYTSAKLLGIFLNYCGEKGELGIELYKYLRWVDNIVDDKETSQDLRISFINRRKNILSGDSLNDETLDLHEASMLNLPWNSLSEEYDLIVRDLLFGILDTCEFDVLNSNLDGRNSDEVATYATMLLNSAIRMTSIIVNGKDINLDDKMFEELMTDWLMIASLRDFGDDLSEGLLHFPLTQDELDILHATDDFEERSEIVRQQLLPNSRFEELNRQYISSLLSNSFAFFKVDLPFWQQFLCSMYNLRGVIKHSKIKYPNFEQ
jgi:hypothetical protein